mmetsp:Transcript_13563/g.26674  ORF Transcript_13563/g.26674 Transcript_13563/m.26674 type:complete len:202 (+) Transcript_13563:76-681(+)
MRFFCLNPEQRCFAPTAEHRCLQISWGRWGCTGSSHSSSCAEVGPGMGTSVPVAVTGSAHLAAATQKVRILPLPLMSISPRHRMSSPVFRPLPMQPPASCLRRILAQGSEQWMRPGCELLSILLAVLTVSPNRQYRGLRAPTTLATTGPECSPTRRWMEPSAGLSGSMRVSAAARMASTAKEAMRRQWSAAWSSTRLVTAM